VRLGIIGRCDNTGLGNQTLELVKMLNPSKVLLIDSTPFHNNRQYLERYNDFPHTTVVGTPTTDNVFDFISSLDVVLSCETFYHKKFVAITRKKKVKTILQYNFEFFSGFNYPDEQMPTILLGPTLWRIEEMQEKFGDRSEVLFLPPPTNHKDFSDNRTTNIKDSKRLLHIAGKAAAHDRNGTKSVIEMLKYSNSDYELVIKSQTPLEIDCDDKRLTIDTSPQDNHADLYSGFDAMVLPRRYAGLCLPMNEALLSGLPVFMTDVSPNNIVLPEKWLVKTELIGNFMAKKSIDLYEVDSRHLARKIDRYFSTSNKKPEKNDAFDLGYENFSTEVLKQKYIDLIEAMRE